MAGLPTDFDWWTIEDEDPMMPQWEEVPDPIYPSPQPIESPWMEGFFDPLPEIEQQEQALEPRAHVPTNDSDEATPLHSRRAGKKPKNTVAPYYLSGSKEATPLHSRRAEKEPENTVSPYYFSGSEEATPLHSRRVGKEPENTVSPYYFSGSEEATPLHSRRAGKQPDNTVTPEEFSGGEEATPSIAENGENKGNPKTVQRRKIRTNEDRAERQRKFYEELRAVNGVVSPSKLLPGQSPIGVSDSSKVLRHGNLARDKECPICGELFGRPVHVQSHFANCVHRNGNPNGVHWDDKLVYKPRKYGKDDK